MPTNNKFVFVSQPGDRIPGSRLLRGYCFRCGSPMRVSSAAVRHECSDCTPRTPPVRCTGLVPRQYVGFVKTLIDQAT
jgi:hypothetical protein